jgi:hypothetical protein
MGWSNFEGATFVRKIGKFLDFDIKDKKNKDLQEQTRAFICNNFTIECIEFSENIQDIETIDLYLTLMKMNLKRKKYTFSTYCIKNLEDSKKTYDEILEKETLFYFNERYGRD